MRTARVVAATAAAVGLVVAATVGAGSAQATGEAAPQATRPSGTIVVSAAASLTDVFPVIAAGFMKRFPGTNVTFNFGGSSGLVAQVLAGAPVDVLATASEPTMWKAVDAGMVSRPLLIAKNSMAVAMPSDNPARITSLADLTRPGVLVGVCAVAVPCGTAARDVLVKNGLSITPVTYDLDVRILLNKVISGDLDAGIVYVTDVRAVGDQVSSVSIPASRNVTTTYPIAAVKASGNAATAAAFVAYVRYTPGAQSILRAYGFAKPW